MSRGSAHRDDRSWDPQDAEDTEDTEAQAGEAQAVRVERAVSDLWWFILGGWLMFQRIRRALQCARALDLKQIDVLLRTRNS